MKCIVTAGPTYEPLDGVRRLTNFSSGRLGSELASFLTARGHETTLLIGQQATFRGERHVRKVWRRASRGELTEVHAGKLPTREGTLLAELAPTPKIIAELREWFPHAW